VSHGVRQYQVGGFLAFNSQSRAENREVLKTQVVAKPKCTLDQDYLAHIHILTAHKIYQPHHDFHLDIISSTTSAIMADTTVPKTPEEVAKENDLLPKVIAHLDRHLIFPLLQFAGEDEDSSQEIAKAKYELLKKTNMTDYVASLYCEINDLETEQAPKEFASKRQEVLDRLKLFEQETEKITDLLSREDVVTSLRSDKVANLEYLKKEHDVSCPASGIWALQS